MRDRLKYYFVNWVDGMKINKSHFMAQDNAIRDVLHDNASLHLTPHRYGVLPPSVAGENTFSVRVSLDNQNTLRVVVEACQAVTPGGVRISIPAFSSPVSTEADCMPETIQPLLETNGEFDWWIVLIVNPYDVQGAGTPDLTENPPRFPYLLPTYTIRIVPSSQYRQFIYYPYALTIGKIYVGDNGISLQEFYIPPCYSVSAHPVLISYLEEFDRFLASLERHCTQIIQKILQKEQKNEKAELVMFLCDRVMLYLGQALTASRWTLSYDSPSALFFTVAALARIMKNTIDLRIGSGKEELMNYLSEWCGLKQGELESLLTNVAGMNYDHNNIYDKNIPVVDLFMSKISKLFAELSKLEYIGKPKPAGFVVKEELPIGEEPRKTSKPRFLG
jgi:hypothetical protein